MDPRHKEQRQKDIWKNGRTDCPCYELGTCTAKTDHTFGALCDDINQCPFIYWIDLLN